MAHRSIAISLCGLAVACGGGGGTGNDATGGGAGTIGLVNVWSQSSSGSRSVFGGANFWMPGTGAAEGDPYGAVALGACDATELELSFGLGTPLMVGPSITVTAAGADTMTLTWLDLGNGAPPSYDSMGNPATFPGNTAYDVAIPGMGTIPAATLPAAFTLPLANVTMPTQLQTGGFVPITAGQPLDFTWTAGNSTAIVIALGAGPSTVTCRAPDTGSFSVPGSVTSMLGTHGNIYFRSYRYSTVTFDGKDLIMFSYDIADGMY